MYQRAASAASFALSPGRGRVDLVVDVGDVLDERHVVAALAAASGEATSRRRTGARCRRGCAGRRSGRRSTCRSGLAGLGELDEPAGGGVIEPHRPSAGPRPRERGDHGPELGPALAAGEREPQRLQVAADRLQLAHDVLRAEPPFARSSLKRSSVGRASSPSATASGSRTMPRELARLDEVARAAERRARARPARRPAPASSSSDMAGDRLDREPADPRQVVVDVVLGDARARRGSRARPRPGCPRRGATRRSRRTRASRACARPRPGSGRWWMYSGGFAPSASVSSRWRLSFGRWSFPRMTCVIPKLDVVDDARELVRRRPVLAQERDPAEPVAAERARRRRGSAPGARSAGPGPSSHATPSHSRSRRISSSPPGTFRAGSVSSIRSRKLVAEVAVGDGGSARCRRGASPSGWVRKRTLFMLPPSLEVERVADVERIRRIWDDARLAVLAPAAPLVEASRSSVVLEHPEVAAS